MYLVYSLDKGPGVKHPDKGAIIKLRRNKRSLEKPTFLEVHMISHPCENMRFFT